jgi:hypothetical protein
MFNLEYLVDQMFVTERARKRWKSVLHKLGTVPDKKIARKIGVSVSAVCYVRGNLGIMPVNFPKQCAKYGIECGSTESEVSNA